MHFVRFMSGRCFRLLVKVRFLIPLSNHKNVAIKKPEANNVFH